MNGNFNYPNYIGVSDADTFDQAFMRIVKAIISCYAQFLFGAGMSGSSGLPVGKDLLIELLKEYFPSPGVNPPSLDRLKELASEFPFEAIVEAVEKKPGLQRDDLTRSLKELLLDPTKEPSKAHHDFMSICYYRGSPKLLSVFTTNYDYLLEDVIGRERTKTITENSAKEIGKAQQDGLIPVIHLHGTLDEKYEITESDVSNVKHRVIKSEFKNALYGADAFVFVGYSMTDPDFKRIYMEYREDWKSREENKDKTTYVVSPPKDEFSYRLGTNIWELRGAVWIPLSAEQFFAKLKYFMESYAEIEIRKKVKEKYDIKDENILNDKIERTAEILGIESYDALRFLLETPTRVGGAK